MKERITEILMRANIECDVRHVGGTAIPGMCSKPIVDVLVTVDSEDMEIAPHALAREFCCLGECGRPGRYFFSDGDTEDDAVYIHLTTAANQVARDQLEFKDILLACPDVREEYLSRGQLFIQSDIGQGKIVVLPLEQRILPCTDVAPLASEKQSHCRSPPCCEK